MPATVRNPAREKLDQGQLSLGVGVRMTRSVEIAKAVAGFDWPCAVAGAALQQYAQELQRHCGHPVTVT